MSTTERTVGAPLKVFISGRASRCAECQEDLGLPAWIFLAGDRGASCLACADLDHLVFLPSGDAAVTRRAQRGSSLSAVVLKWSRSRKRYERQGLLVEPPRSSAPRPSAWPMRPRAGAVSALSA